MYRGTKAQIITKLHNECHDVNTLPFYVVYSKAYYENKQLVIDEIINIFKNSELAVRSSCKKEDAYEVSNAGKYCSVLNVGLNYIDVESAIEKVYKSYESTEDEEVLVQPMLNNIVKSGVVFTKDLYTLAPYYSIDYFEGEDSSAVTSGISSDDKILYLYRNIVEDEIADFDIKNLIKTVRTLEVFFNDDSLDIEFAITDKHEVYIFQVRPISNSKRQKEKISIEQPLVGIGKKIEKLMRPHPFLYGETTCFGVMPDWNPAEILGAKPKKLAISLYKELVTDNIWAHQREDYGYRDLTKHPLMVLFCGIPYIDTRITFNSFVPAALNDKIARKLVDYYLDLLKSFPALHDKIEFEIVFSCYYFGISDDLKQLLDYGFNENEIKRIEFALLELTNNIISPQDGLYKKDIEKIEILRQNHNKIINSDISVVDKIYWLIEECKSYGTLPFAGVARAAFIAVQFLKSIVNRKIISANDYDSFMCGLNTISKQISIDRKKLAEGAITKDEFLEKYGHIRPGTYDIQSARYDENFEYYFEDNNIQNSYTEEKKFEFSNEQMQLLDIELEQNGLMISARQLIEFIKEAIEGREYLKFVFTKTVSEILRLTETYGHRLGIETEELAHLDIGIVKQLYVDLYSGSISDVFKENIRMNKAQYNTAKYIKLPSLIVSPKDIYQFTLLEEEPNYITTNTALSKIVKEDNIYDEDIQNRIVFIKSADPGYDFLFTKNIAGLITQFGGANSHMAIRCAELGIPAVIGAGEKNYNAWSQAGTILLDCANKNVKIMN